MTKKEFSERVYDLAFNREKTFRQKQKQIIQWLDSYTKEYHKRECLKKICNGKVMFISPEIFTWEKKKILGNIKYDYILRHGEIGLCTIREFDKGEYSLPEGLFPRDETGMTIRKHNLQKAKSMCEKWFFELSKSIYESKKKINYVQQKK